MSSFIYDTAFNRLEKARWNLNEDIPWDKIDPKLKDDPSYKKNLQQIKIIALAEFTSLAATNMFLRDFHDDLDFSSFMSIWYYEEMKHHYVLRKYLEINGVQIEDKELASLNQSLPFGGVLPTICMHLVGEIKLHCWYKTVSRISDEPVATVIFDHLAADELRHGQVYYEFMEKYVKKDPSALGTFLRMARFMFREEAGNVKHPVPQLVEGNADFNFNEAMTGIFDSWADHIRDANKKAERMVFKYLSKLSGEEINNEDDLSRVIKLDKKRARTSPAASQTEASA